MDLELSTECEEVLKLLSRSRNVLISGPPGTGKSRLLAEVSFAFESAYGVSTVESGQPKLRPIGNIPIPPTRAAPEEKRGIPSIDKSNRKVFRTVFHQNSKFRDFVSGIIPSLNKGDGNAFVVVKGTLYRSSEHAKLQDGAALLIIDEINRGPAVQVFGGAIVAMESDKRLSADGTKHVETQYFELLDPQTGEIIEYALPHDLYILAAMNQADASVEPLDVAFLRRWEPFHLGINESALRSFYGLDELNENYNLSNQATVKDALEASVRAWKVINEKITLGRGSEFQIGHGALMTSVNIQSLSLDELLDNLCIGWAKVLAHVEEVFFGDYRGIAEVLNALDGPSFNPFQLIETTFADDFRFKLEGPVNLSSTNIYDALRAFSRG